MIQLITDSTASLPQDVADRLGIPIIPQVVMFGDESFLEGIEIDNETFLNRLQSEKELPKTAAPPPGLFVEQFKRLGPADTAICIHPSAEISGTVRSAMIAKEQFPEADIRIIDTRAIASPLAQMVLIAHQWVQEGRSADDIIQGIEQLMARSRIFFLVNTLEYLQKGGRIGGASAFIGSILQVKPILELRDGRIEPLERERTHKRALKRLKELVIAQSARGQDAHLTVLHAAVPDEAKALADDLAGQLGVDTPVLITDVTPAIVTHAGPGVLGVGFFAAG